VSSNGPGNGNEQKLTRAVPTSLHFVKPVGPYNKRINWSMMTMMMVRVCSLLFISLNWHAHII